MYLSHGNTIRSVFPWAPLKTILQQPWGYFMVDLFYAGLLATGMGVVLRTMGADGAPPSPPHDRRPDGRRLLMSCFLLPPAALWAASFFVPRLYIERSMIIALPFFLMLLSAGALCFRHRWLRRALIVLMDQDPAFRLLDEKRFDGLTIYRYRRWFS